MIIEWFSSNEMRVERVSRHVGGLPQSGPGAEIHVEHRRLNDMDPAPGLLCFRRRRDGMPVAE